MSENKKDRWGCPDWRDASAYPVSGDSLKQWEWKWQFVRRLPHYRNYWVGLDPIPLEDAPDSRNHPTQYRNPPNEDSETITMKYSLRPLPSPWSAGLREHAYPVAFGRHKM